LGISQTHRQAVSLLNGSVVVEMIKPFDKGTKSAQADRRTS